MILVYLFFFCVTGITGIWLWPYSINTWTEYASNGENSQALGKAGGFGIGVIPYFGAFQYPAAFITMICDIAFIPDEYPQKDSNDGDKKVENGDKKVGEKVSYNNDFRFIPLT